MTNDDANHNADTTRYTVSTCTPGSTTATTAVAHSDRKNATALATRNTAPTAEPTHANGRETTHSTNSSTYSTCCVKYTTHCHTHCPTAEPCTGQVSTEMQGRVTAAEVATTHRHAWWTELSANVSHSTVHPHLESVERPYSPKMTSTASCTAIVRKTALKDSHIHRAVAPALAALAALRPPSHNDAHIVRRRSTNGWRSVMSCSGSMAATSSSSVSVSMPTSGSVGDLPAIVNFKDLSANDTHNQTLNQTAHIQTRHRRETCVSDCGMSVYLRSVQKWVKCGQKHVETAAADCGAGGVTSTERTAAARTPQ